ncbi:SDR family oxidoreductase [Halosimplex rubrum]|uniref:SDR family oxidoreductase n=1 Tax=Halosimplex rubrum TaxID=869889 RepID=A0A7D5TNM7_9EURY|nr:SDR family oxidoreductase [Halosimplex rubrum]QLH79112.1 SDR family oxidoreductase [Halosimplex rubrum]
MRLVTGFPGFLGSALVERLLGRSDEPVACLVQTQYREAAARRAATLTDDAGVPRNRIRLVEGDVTDPELAVDDYERLRRETRVVYHLAAVYDLGVARPLAERVNVDGTSHVLDLAARADADRFHYVSTCYVSGRYDGTFTHRDLAVGQSFHNHYEATKFEAERLVQAAMTDGLPATVYRPAIAVGDSRTGETQKFDGPYYLLKLLLRQWPVAAVPVPLRPSATRLNVVPRDFVVDAMAAISAREESVGEVYQLCNPHPPTILELVRALGRAAGRRVLPVRGTARLARVATERVPGVADALGVEPAALPYLSQPTTYTDENTRRALADTDVRCPLFSSYADRLVAYARDHLDEDTGAMV